MLTQFSPGPPGRGLLWTTKDPIPQFHRPDTPIPLSTAAIPGILIRDKEAITRALLKILDPLSISSLSLFRIGTTTNDHDPNSYLAVTFCVPESALSVWEAKERADAMKDYLLWEHGLVDLEIVVIGSTRSIDNERKGPPIIGF